MRIALCLHVGDHSSSKKDVLEFLCSRVGRGELVPQRGSRNDGRGADHRFHRLSPPKLSDAMTIGGCLTGEHLQDCVKFQKENPAVDPRAKSCRCNHKGLLKGLNQSTDVLHLMDCEDRKIEIVVH